MANLEVRTALTSFGIKHYELAAKLGIHDSALSRKLRTELPEETKNIYLEKIKELASERLELLNKTKASFSQE